MKQKNCYDEENRLELLSQLGDSLEILNRVIKRELFRCVLNQACRKEDTGKRGHSPYNVVMMFKILVLHRLYNLSDDQTEYQIIDRNKLSVQVYTFRIKHLGCENRIWRTAEVLSNHDLARLVFIVTYIRTRFPEYRVMYSRAITESRLVDAAVFLRITADNVLDMYAKQCGLAALSEIP